MSRTIHVRAQKRSSRKKDRLREHAASIGSTRHSSTHRRSEQFVVEHPPGVATNQVRVVNSLGCPLDSCRILPLRCPRGDRKGRPKGGHSMATKKGAWAGGFWEALTYAWMRRPGIRVVPYTAYESSSASAPGPSSHEQSVPGPHPWRHMGDDRGDDVATVVQLVPTEERPC